MGVWNTARDSLDQFGPAAVIDIISIAVLIYLALLLLKGTTAMSLLRGIFIVVVGVVILAQVMNLTVLDWLLRNSFPALLIAIPIIFQSEIRRFFERVGRTSRWPWPGRALYEGVVDTIADASLGLAEKRHGAIIVIERETGLEDYIDTGQKLDALASKELLMSIFFPNTALHDGAVIMREDRVVFYVDANRDVSEIVYRIKATNVGTYVVPPAYGEAMYDRSVIGRSAAGRITVTRP